LFGNSKGKKEKDLKKEELLSTHTPLYSCEKTPNNLKAVVKPIKSQVYQELGSCTTNEVKNQISVIDENWPWNECGCAGACWHGRSTASVPASLSPHPTEELEPEKTPHHTRNPAPLSNQPAKPIMLEDFLKKFEGSGARPKLHKLYLRPEVIVRKLN